MENGFYNRRELSVVIYESLNGGAFVVISNDRYPNRPVVMTGDEALEVVTKLVEKINTVTDEEEA